MIITTVQLKQILAAGGSLVIDGSEWTLSQLKELATTVAGGKGKIVVKNISNITADQLSQIAGLAPGQIVFDLTVSTLTS